MIHHGFKPSGGGVRGRATMSRMEIFDWSAAEKEELSPGIARQVIHTERMTVARIFLASGAVVPVHHHENEQVTLLEQGRLRFTAGDEIEDLRPGQALRIPPHVVHRVEAIEDSVAIDLFCPRREDWIRGDDAYLRG